AAAAPRFLCSLPRYLRHPLSLEEARATLRLRLQRRAANFLDLVRRTVYADRTSPYRQLLALAGCEYGDLEQLVCCDGLEAALATLYQRGRYLTVHELEGLGPVVR